MSEYIKKSNFVVNQENLVKSLSAYYKQIRYDFDNEIDKIVLKNTEFCDLFFKTFDQKFNPKTHTEDFKKTLVRLEEIAKNDKILSTFVEILDATVRTNFYQKDKDYISLKIKGEKISEMPQPIMFAEIFIYCDEFEGAHLRRAPIARGGFRLSDRHDYRTENLGLVKAQTLKNVIITPSGAKACIYIKQKKEDKTENNLFIKSCYSKFVSGLLDLTDNEIDGKKISPENVVKYDEFDKYLVAAADKGTASFSDIANSISKAHNFWLKDAFASGGSNGYSHKDLGITSRGVYECVKNSFLELGIDLKKDELTVVGIGDMSGDVFGNGMLLLGKIRLIGAFNHQHIFIDPNPDVEKSDKERRRLFDNPQLKWSDYDKSIISNGGGIFERFAGDIELNDEIRKIFDIDSSLTKINPEDLMNKILLAKVDLIWNGGIGTFVKGESENHEEVKDAFNDKVRVNGNQIRAKVFAEGGNLGVTQKGRINASRVGVKINMDSIDNSAGVACSDSEVNIKIALDQAKIGEKEKSEIVKDLTDEVVKIVLRENYYQSKIIGVEAFDNIDKTECYRKLINKLESEKILDRKQNSVPEDSVLRERVRDKKDGLSRTQICSLVSNVKLFIKTKVLEYKTLINDEYFIQNALIKYFPRKMQNENCMQGIMNHPLRENIISTKITNIFIDSMGLLSIQRFDDAKIDYDKAIFSFYVLDNLFGVSKLFKHIRNQDGLVEFSQQVKAFSKLQAAVFNAIVFIGNKIDFSKTIQENIDLLKSEIDGIANVIKGDCCSVDKSSCCFDSEYTTGLKLLKMSFWIPVITKVAKDQNISLKDSLEISKKALPDFKIVMKNIVQKMEDFSSSEDQLSAKIVSNFIEFASNVASDSNFAVKNIVKYDKISAKIKMQTFSCDDLFV